MHRHTKDTIRDLVSDDLSHIDSPIPLIIPAGTVLYRFAPRICQYKTDIERHKRKCSDTGRHGIFFSTYILQALAMALEYNKSGEVGQFVTTKEIHAIVGKYSYRLLNPAHYFQVNETKRELVLRLGVMPTKKEEVSHFNHFVLPIIDYTSDEGKHIAYDMEKFESRLEAHHGEIFVTDNAEIRGIKLVKTWKLDLATLKKIIEEHISALSPNDMELYNEALTEIVCKRRTAVRREPRKTGTHKRKQRR